MHLYDPKTCALSKSTRLSQLYQVFEGDLSVSRAGYEASVDRDAVCGRLHHLRLTSDLPNYVMVPSTVSSSSLGKQKLDGMTRNLVSIVS
jgi:hypothetical protein